MRSSAALVYNCKQARIVLAGTSFATTGTLVPQRSAELCEANQKRQFLKTEGFDNPRTKVCPCNHIRPLLVEIFLFSKVHIKFILLMHLQEIFL